MQKVLTRKRSRAVADVSESTSIGSPSGRHHHDESGSVSTCNQAEECPRFTVVYSELCTPWMIVSLTYFLDCRTKELASKRNDCAALRLKVSCAAASQAGPSTAISINQSMSSALHR